MTLSIPYENLFNQHEAGVDLMITMWGVNCILNYPPIRTPCPNCQPSDPLIPKSSQVYLPGGPIPFTDGICPYCQGEGIKEVAQTENKKFRVFWEPKQFIDTHVPSLSLPDNTVQIEGYMIDVPNLLRAQTIILNDQLIPTMNMVYRRFGEPVPHGFRSNRYFLSYLTRV